MVLKPQDLKSGMGDPGVGIKEDSCRKRKKRVYAVDDDDESVLPTLLFPFS